MLALAMFFGKKYSENKLYSIIVSNLYYSKKDGSIHLKAIDSLLGKKKNVFKRAKQYVDDNIDICNILIEFNKLKAIISAIVENDEKIIRQATKKYEMLFNFDSDKYSIENDELQEYLNSRVRASH
jgi:hypothetical protein